MQANEATYDKRAFPIARPTTCAKGAECKRFQEEFINGAQSIDIDNDYTLDDVLLGKDQGGDAPGAVLAHPRSLPQVEVLPKLVCGTNSLQHVPSD